MNSSEVVAGLQPRSWLMRTALSVVDMLRRPISAFGVDYRRFRALLTVYAMLDERRGSRNTGDGVGSGSPWSTGLVLSCVANLLMGIFVGFTLLIESPLAALGVQQIVVFVFAVMILVSDYSSVLLDDTDSSIVSPLPVPDRTVAAARLAHIAVYLSVVMGSLALPGLVIGCFARPILTFVPVYLLATALTVALALGFSFGVLLLATRFFNVEKFRNLLIYFQVLSSVFFFAMFQLLPRLMRGSSVTEVVMKVESLAYWLPPLHQGGLLALAEGDTRQRNFVLAVLAVGLPSLALFIMARLASKGFLRSLARTSGSKVASAKMPRRRLRNLLLGDRVSRAGYDFFHALSRRERDYRLRTYPMVAFALVLGVALTLRSGELKNPVLICSSIYLLGLYTPGFLLQARFSECWQARWILLASPMRDAGRFVAGAMLALMTTTLLPLFVVFFGVAWAIGGHAVLADAAFASLATFVMASASVFWFGRRVPFTEKQPKKGSSGGLAQTMGALLVMGGLVALHLLARRSDWLFGVLMLTLLALLFWIRLALTRLRVESNTWP